MGLARDQLTLENPRKPELRPVEVNALADSGSVYLCIPHEVAQQLELEELSKKQVHTADGKAQSCPYVGPIIVRFDNRTCCVGAIVLGDDVLLGAIPMEDMDLVVVPKTRRVIVNPEHPNFAVGRV